MYTNVMYQFVYKNLYQFGVNQLRCLHPHFDGFGSSAMAKSSESKVLSGRPFGGTGFVYNKKFAKCLKPLLNYSHERLTVLELSMDEGRIILINVYFPYYNSRDLENYTSLYKDTVGFADSVMHSNRDASFILMADFNCSLYDTSHRYTRLLLPLFEKYNLMSAYETDVNFNRHSASAPNVIFHGDKCFCRESE